MAISSTLYQLLKRLKPLLPPGGTLLEIGEANWYGDIDPLILLEECDSVDDEEAVRFAAEGTNLFDVARAMYKVLMDWPTVVSVDFNGTEIALRYDLNAPLPIGHNRTNRSCPGYAGFEAVHREGKEGFACTCPGQQLSERFDVVINHGTAEHIFNVAQVFKTMHDRCEVGGLMIHDAPFTGWIDHGFYCLQPTLFYDLAAANNYEIVRMALHEIKSKHIAYIESREHVAKMAEAGEIPNNALLFVVLRKIVDGEFRLPLQGYYSRNLSEAGREAWSKMR